MFRLQFASTEYLLIATDPSLHGNSLAFIRNPLQHHVTSDDDGDAAVYYSSCILHLKAGILLLPTTTWGIVVSPFPHHGALKLCRTCYIAQLLMLSGDCPHGGRFS